MRSLKITVQVIVLRLNIFFDKSGSIETTMNYPDDIDYIDILTYILKNASNSNKFISYSGMPVEIYIDGLDSPSV